MTAKGKKELQAKCAAASIALTDILDTYQQAVDDLQEKYDAKSEKWQQSDKGTEMQDEINTLEELRDKAQDCLDTVNELEPAE